MLKTIIVRKAAKDIVYADKNNEKLTTEKGGRHFFMTNEQMKSVATSTGNKLKGSQN